jgi:putative membrane protein
MFVLAGLVSLCALAPALAQPRALPTPDFIKAAAATDEFERQEGRMAEKVGATAEVRDFGKMMVRDHTRTTEALKAAIHKAGMPAPPPPELTSEQKSNIAALQGLHGVAFDRPYMEQQIQAHQQALGVMRGYAASGDNPVLRQAAAETVPIVQQHLQAAQAITH